MRLPRQFQACFAFFDEKISRAQEHITPRSLCAQNLFFKKKKKIYIYIYLYIKKIMQDILETLLKKLIKELKSIILLRETT